MKIKTSDLTGSALDWAVARATGIPTEEIYVSGSGKHQRLFRRQRDEEGNLNGRYVTGPDLLFSSKWEAGGPIIERELIATTPSAEHEARWIAKTTYEGEWFETEGPTPLIASMRCYVASKLGDSVDIPDKLR